MKKTPSKGPEGSPTRRRNKKKPAADEMRSHYDFDYSKSQSNRFASRMTEEKKRAASS